MRRRRLGAQKDSGKIEEPFREDAVCPRSTRASQVAPVVKNPPANAGDVFFPWVGTNPLRKARHPTPVFLPGESLVQRSLVGYSP